MPESSCLCGAVRISFSSAPISKFMCSCLDDRKITGSLFGALNLMVPTTAPHTLRTTAGASALKTFSKTVESGSSMTSFFCGECGSTLYRASSGYPGVVMVKAGCVDGLDVEMARPELELFGRSHVGWVKGVEGVECRHGG